MLTKGLPDCPWVDWSAAVIGSHCCQCKRIVNHLREVIKPLGETTGISRDHEDFSKTNGLICPFSHKKIGFLGDVRCKRWSLVGGSRSLGDMPSGADILYARLLPSSCHDALCSASPCPSCHGTLVVPKLCATSTTHIVSKLSSLAKN